MHILNKTNIDFMRWRWHAVALSWVVILAGLGIIMTKGLPRGIEFAGGTSVLLQFDNPPSDDAVREALNRNYPGGGQDAIVQAYGAPTLRTKMIRVPHVGEEAGASLSSTSESVEKAIRAGNLGNFTVVGTEIVGPAVGKELSQRGLIATVLSLVGLLAYIAFRYQLSFAVGAVVATIHDLLVVVAFLAFFRYDLTLNVIAAILTVTGYSTNDTIVIFDRVRENRAKSDKPLIEVLNDSINQTLARTILTTSTVVLTLLVLFLFNFGTRNVLEGFSFAMLVGVLSGAYSTVYIASPVLLWFERWQAKRGGPGSHGTLAETVGEPTP